MEASDYFEDFGEGDGVEEEEEEEVTIKPTGKGKKIKQKQLTKDKLNGELEQLALGEEDKVRTTLEERLVRVRYASVFFLFQIL